VGPTRSSGVPHRAAGVRPTIQSLNRWSSTRLWVISVWIYPGAIALICKPAAAHSAVIALVRFRRPPLAAV